MNADECKSTLIMMGWQIHDYTEYGNMVFQLNNDYLSFQGDQFIILYWDNLFGNNNISVQFDDVINKISNQQ